MQPIADYRTFVTRWLSWACGGASGVSEFAPVYRQITENRDTPGAKPGQPGYYSSCGDLAWAMLEACGLRAPWTNRASLGQYRVGLNVSRLAWCPAARDPHPADHYEAGDVLIVWDRQDTTDAHVICVLEESPGGKSIITAEYGQPGGAIRTRGLSRLAGMTSIGGRRVRRVLPLLDVLALADRTGELVPVRLDTDTDRAPPPSEPVTIAPPLDPSRLPALSAGPADSTTERYVELMQQRLNITGTRPALVVDGHFGGKSKTALIQFQLSRALTPDGICGPRSWAELLREVSR
jgi:peptidoglycan hydrolase-like protein with peptidoglycan-binding domain